MARYFLASQASHLRSYLDRSSHSATVCAEYLRSSSGFGEAECVDGSEASYRLSDNPALRPNGILKSLKVIAGNYFSLSLLGCGLSMEGLKPDAHCFWKLVNFEAQRGRHMLSQSEASPEDRRRLYAFWAHPQSSEIYSMAEGVTEVTDPVRKAATILNEILQGKEEYLQAGDEYRARQEALNQSTFHSFGNRLVVRKGTYYQVDTLFDTPDNKIGEACLVFDAQHHRILLRRENTSRIDACDILRAAVGVQIDGGPTRAVAQLQYDLTASQITRIAESVAILLDPA